MPQACQCLRHIWTGPSILCFNFFSSLNWSGSWTRWSLYLHYSLNILSSIPSRHLPSIIKELPALFFPYASLGKCVVCPYLYLYEIKQLFYLEQCYAYIKLSLSLVGRQVMFLLLGLSLIIQAVQPFCKITVSYVSPNFTWAEEMGTMGNIWHVTGTCPARESLLLKAGR